MSCVPSRASPNRAESSNSGSVCRTLMRNSSSSTCLSQSEGCFTSCKRSAHQFTTSCRNRRTAAESSPPSSLPISARQLFGRLVVCGESQNLILRTITESRPAFNQCRQSSVINLIQNPTRVGMRVVVNRDTRFSRQFLRGFSPCRGYLFDVQSAAPNGMLRKCEAFLMSGVTAGRTIPSGSLISVPDCVGFCVAFGSARQ